MPSPRFDGKRWRIQAQKDGKRYSFSSSLAGAKGKREVITKYERWLYDEGYGSGQKTVERVCADYLDDLGQRRGFDSEAYIQCEKYIRLYIAPKCSSKKMCKMTLRDWQSIINTATGLKKPLSHKTLSNLRCTIMSIIKFAYCDYQCEMPRGQLYVPQGHSRQEKEILQPDQIARLLQPSSLWYYNLFVFLLLTGMRPSEALGLQVDDITNDHITIKRGVTAKGKISECKNANAKRMIPLGSLAKSVIKSTIERNEQYNLHTKWIFCDKHGDKGNQSTMRNQWLMLKKERELSGTVYSLRHTFISCMKSVIPEQTIKDIVGHSVSFDTFGTYGHIVDGESQRVAKVIDLTFGANLGAHLSVNDAQQG